MRLILRRRALMLLGACALWSGLCVHAADRADWIVSPALLDHAGLTVLWQQTLPLKTGETFAETTIVGDRLYLRSDRNYLWSLDRQKGDVLFSRSIAPRGIPVLGLVPYADGVISVVGDQLEEFSADTGTRRRRSDLELGIVAAPARNSQFFYVGAADRRLHVLRAKDLVRIFKVAAENNALITTVVADESLVVFGTDAGNLVGMMADAPRKLWQFDAPKALAGPVIRDGNSFYFACKDTSVYRVDALDTTTVDLIWKHQTEAVLDRAPRVTEDFVYQYAVGRGLTAIDKQTGRTVWSLPEGVDLLAEADNRAYVITKVRTLAVMDNATGKQLYSVNVAPVTDHASNVRDARIYIADGDGRIACLQPTR